jgi:hypothetical protein
MLVNRTGSYKFVSQNIKRLIIKRGRLKMFKECIGASVVFLYSIMVQADVNNLGDEQNSEPPNNKRLEQKLTRMLHDEDDETSVTESKYGSFSGVLGTYWQTVNTKDNRDREEFGNADLTLHYLSPKWNGLSLELGATYNLELRDKNEIYDEAYQEEGLIHEAFVKWETDEFSLFVGRMPIDYLLLGDYIDGVAFSLTAIDDLEIRGVWAKNQAAVDPDEVTDFEKLNDSDGIFGIEAEYELLEGCSLTAVDYFANDLANQTGAKLKLETESDSLANFAVLEGYHVNDLQAAPGDENGHVWHINDTVTINKIFTVGAGYIETAKKTGAAGLFNNPYDPFEEDTIEELANASVWYVTCGVALFDKVTLDTIYGQKRFDNIDLGVTDQIDEFDVVLGVDLGKGIGVELAYINYRQEQDDDWDKVWGHLTYEF